MLYLTLIKAPQLAIAMDRRESKVDRDRFSMKSCAVASPKSPTLPTSYSMKFDNRERFLYKVPPSKH